ncbi:MAG: nucleotide-binding protein [Planctomycetes bacterium]|nr:nucleotide-binding protein [Planctomycetota bacterium]
MSEPVTFDGGTGSESYVGDLYRTAAERVLCVGASFYRTIKLHKELIVQRLKQGVVFEFCFLSRKADFARIAPQFGQTGDQLRTEVEATWAEADELSAKYPRCFRVIPTVTSPVSRIYVADPDAERPRGAIVFYAASTDSVRLPAFKVDNFREPPWQAYFEDALRKVQEASSNDVFIIHGHNEAKWRELKEILTALGARPIVLGEAHGYGSVSWLERFIRAAERCEFAIAVFTEDDWVKNKGKQYFQPRPNVLIELGFFISRLTLSNIMILVKGNVKLPSDVEGVVYTSFNENISEVRAKLEVELKAAGVI